MKILLLGKNGQLGWELRRSLAVLGDVVAVDRSDPSPLTADLARPQDLAEMVRRLVPDVIVNAAAYTAVDRAESECDTAQVINAQAPAALAREAARQGAWLLHYSSDYVFDGSGSEPWTEEAPTGPLSVYGRTKLAGEWAIRESGCKHLILRTSWVYAARGSNFVRTMLRLAQERDHLRVVNDQFGAPTGADLLADLSAHLIRLAQEKPRLHGTYHAVPAGCTSWHDYAKHLIECARSKGAPIKVAPEAIEAVSSDAFPTPARRPLNSRLDTSKLRRTFGLELPDWRRGVERTLTELLGL